MTRVVGLCFVALLFISSLPAMASEEYPIVFPVAGENHYTDTWGAARSDGRTHEGTDIMADKMVPVLAAAAGSVGWMHNEQGGRCCAMAIVHDDGYSSWYIHLNNDTPGTDDGQGWGFAPGIEPGVRVEAGQLIGYVGDSGNAESTNPHLHFELRYPSGEAFNSYPSLLEATPSETSRVTWHAGAITAGSMAVDSDSIDLHLSADDGVAAVGDFDGDGVDELAVGGGYEPGWKVSELDGAVSDWSASDAAGAEKLFTGDFDGDGDDDIAAFFPSRAWMGYRSSDGTFSVEGWGKFGGSGWADQLVGDFDGDGKDEILSFHPGTRNWWISHLGGSGFTSSIFASYGTASGWQTHIAADVDGDGAEELLSFHPSNGTWWASHYGGGTRLVFDAATNSGWRHHTALDYDGDGADELAMFHPSNGTWWVVDGSTGRSRATLWATFSTRHGWVSPTAADLNDDGRDDLLIRHRDSGRVWTISGAGGQVSFVGTLVAGAVEDDWLLELGSEAGLLAVTRD